MSLLEPRDHYKPFDYPWMFEAFRMQNDMHWVPESVPLHKDVGDFHRKLTEPQKHLLTQLFRFFTQADTDVAAGYYGKFLPVFPKPEARMMMGAFAAMEGIHQHAYSLLLDTVGMPETEYRVFHGVSEMAEKHDYVGRFRIDTENVDRRALAKALAVYAAFTEGLHLFSSFAMLLAFPQVNLMTGMGQIVTYSVRDESLHIESMIRMFREFIKENPDLWVDDFKAELYQIGRDMVDLEDRFIDLAFRHGDAPNLTAAETKQYIRYICDRRLKQLGLKANYEVDQPIQWLDWMLNGVEFANFFETRATEYSKLTLSGDWRHIWAEYREAV